MAKSVIRIPASRRRLGVVTRERRTRSAGATLARSTLSLLVALVSGCGCLSAGPDYAGDARRLRLTPQTYEWISSLRHPLLESVPIDPDDGFDPDEVALIAVASNPGLRTLRNNRGVAHAQVISAGLLPNPTISIQPYVPVAGQTSGNVAGYSGQFTWSVSPLFLRGPKKRAAELAEESVKLDVAWSEWTVAMQAQLLAYQSILLKEARQIHEANIGELKEALVHIRHAASVGGVTSIPLANAEAALLRAQTANAITNRDIALRAAQLDGLLGGLKGVADHLTGELRIPSALGNLSREDRITGLTMGFMTDLVSRRPDLKALHLAMRSQDAAFRAATRQAFPSIQLGMQVARDPGNFIAIGPTIQIGIPVFNHGQAGRAMARAQSSRLADLLAERMNLARQRIGMAIAEIRGSADTLSYLDDAIVRQDRVVELYKAARNRGATNIIVYYTARTTLVQLRLQRILERTRLWQGLVQLRSESGEYRLTAIPMQSSGGENAQ